MLVDFVLQSLRFAANVPVVTAANVFLYDIVLLKGRYGILMDCRKSRFGGEYQPKFGCSVAITHRSLDLFLEFEKITPDPWKF